MLFGYVKRKCDYAYPIEIRSEIIYGCGFKEEHYGYYLKKGINKWVLKWFLLFKVGIICILPI